MVRNRSEKDEGPPEVESPGVVRESMIAEQISVQGAGPLYAIHERMADGSWQTREDSSIADPQNSRTLVPLKKPFWDLPSRPVDYGSDEDLFNELKEFFTSHTELRDKRCYGVMSAFVLAGHRIDEFDRTSYVFFLGPIGTAKSRNLELLSLTCHRGWIITHPSAAAVFWITDQYCPTLLVDNYEHWPKETRHELDGLFNSGYRRPGVVPRRPRERESGPGIIAYETYCPKALAGTREPPDSLGSRCIFIRTAANKEKFSLGIDKAWAQKLRDKLLAYHFRHFENKETVDLSKIVNPYARVGEIFYGLVTVAPSDSSRNELTQVAMGVFEAQKEEAATGLEAEVVKVVLSAQDKAIDNRLPVETVVNELNLGRAEGDKVRPETIGWILKRLGFTKKRMQNRVGTRAILLDGELLDRLKTTYDVDVTETPNRAINGGLYDFVEVGSDGQKEDLEKPSDLDVSRSNSDGSDGLTVSARVPDTSSLVGRISGFRDDILKTLRNDSRPYLTTEQLVLALGTESGLVSQILQSMEKEGILLEAPPECWRLAK